MGKYSEVIGDLPRFKLENPAYQDKVNAKKKEIVEEMGVAFGVSAIVQAYARARTEKDEHEAREKEINLELEALSQLVVDRYEIEGLSSMKLDTGETVRVQYEPYAVVKDKDEARKWAIANGFERSLQMPMVARNSATSQM